MTKNTQKTKIDIVKDVSFAFVMLSLGFAVVKNCIFGSPADCISCIRAVLSL